MVTITITALLQWLLRIKSQLLTKAQRPCVHLPSPLPQFLGLWPSASSTPSLSPVSGPLHLLLPLLGILCSQIFPWPTPSYSSGLSSNVTSPGRPLRPQTKVASTVQGRLFQPHAVLFPDLKWSCVSFGYLSSPTLLQASKGQGPHLSSCSALFQHLVHRWPYHLAVV